MARGLVTLVVIAAALAAPAHGTIGSVISSFGIPTGSYGYGILAQGNYIYLSGCVTYGNYIFTFNHSGTLLRSRAIDPGNSYPLYSGSRTHLGPGYIALLDNTSGYVKIFSIASGGAPVTSFPISTGLWNLFWDGQYYYANLTSMRGRFTRRTPSGGSAGSWTCAGWPSSMTYCYGAEYAQRGNNGSGPYFVAGSGRFNTYCMTTFPSGSLVATWTLPSPYILHMAYGDSSNPVVYGAAIWATLASPYGVREIDIDARNASTILPASIGKIRALYR